MKDIAISQNNPQPYHLPSSAVLTHPAIGIDIGGTKMNAAVVMRESFPESTSGTLTAAAGYEQEVLKSLIHTATPTDADAFLNTLVEMIQTLAQGQIIAAVGISTAGVVDSIHGQILGSTGNMPALQHLRNLKERLEKKVQLPVHIENDANAAAYGEWRSGAAQGAKNMFAITLGTGVGMGIVFDGRMHRGSHFYAGEGGHIAISYHRERKCTCGRWDCWEAFASGTGLKITAELTLEAASETAQAEFLKKYTSDNVVSTYAVISAWQDDNHIGTQIMDEWHNHIAVGLGSLINVMDPDMIVVGGGLAQFVNFDLLLERTRERSISNAFQLVPAQLGNHAGIVGAAHLALESLR